MLKRLTTHQPTHTVHHTLPHNKITELSFFNDLDHYHHDHFVCFSRLDRHASICLKNLKVCGSLCGSQHCCFQPPQIENMTVQEYPALVLQCSCYACFRQQLTPMTNTKILVQPQFLQPVCNKLTSCISFNRSYGT
jgi:hypothetical protein